MPLLRCKARQMCAFFCVFQYALTFEVHDTKIGLSLGMPLLGKWVPFFQGSFKVTRFGKFQPFVETLRGGS